MESLLFDFLDHTLMFFRDLIIIDANQQQISLIILQRIAVVLLLDLSQCASRTLVPFQLDHYRRFIQMQLPGIMHTSAKPLPAGSSRTIV